MASSGRSARKTPAWIVTLVVVIGAIVVLHAGLWLSYGTVEPCEAALARIYDDSSSVAQQAQAAIGLVFEDALTNKLRADNGAMGCYRIALFGE